MTRVTAAMACFAAAVMVASAQAVDLSEPFTGDAYGDDLVTEQPKVPKLGAVGSTVYKAGRTDTRYNNVFGGKDRCVFDADSDDNSWTIRTNDGDIPVSGCVTPGDDETMMPANAANNRAEFDKTENLPDGFTGNSWCFIGEQNDGEGNIANKGKANYNKKAARPNRPTNAEKLKFEEWAYCEETTDVAEEDMTPRYVAFVSFSDDDSKQDGFPCQNQWNFNKGDGIFKVGALNPCLPFADPTMPATQDISPDQLAEIAASGKGDFWCFLDTTNDADGPALGYNPNKESSPGVLDPKTRDWGFCRDMLDASFDDTMAPTAQPTAVPVEETIDTPTPTTDSGSGESTPAPVGSSGPGEEETEETPSPTLVPSAAPAAASVATLAAVASAVVVSHLV